MTPEAEEEPEEVNNEEEVNENESKKDGDTTSKSAKMDAQSSAVEGEEEEEQDKGPVNPYLIMDEIVNDHIEKATMLPPQDPEGQNTLVPDLIIKEEAIIGILESSLNVVCTWIQSEMSSYNAKVKAEGKNLQDQSVEELDENLRKQWPRKGRLEVEIFQERKA